MRGMSVLVALMATILAISVLRLDAAVDKPILPTVTDDEVSDAAGRPCCDAGCGCTKSIPPQCHCGDVKDHCYPGCKMCLCTRSIPPQCRCGDTLSYCPKPCSAKKP
ncbi:Bowman-Birk type proteinase inhibitor [Nymphaea thermarum]|nr:Bowman-Birk type proteinase inhibitor [Nymphaea thermarum]